MTQNNEEENKLKPMPQQVRHEVLKLAQEAADSLMVDVVQQLMNACQATAQKDEDPLELLRSLEIKATAVSIDVKKP